MSTEALLVERDEHIETWTINLPEKRNPISDDDVVAAIRDVDVVFLGELLLGFGWAGRLGRASPTGLGA